MIIRSCRGVFACALLCVAAIGSASAESGFYAGGGIGSAGIELDFTDAGFSLPEFDEDDFAWKVFGGFNAELTALHLGAEIGYVNFGAPAANILGVDVELDSTGFTAFGIAGFDVALVNVFAKLGYVSWDLEATISAVGLPPQSVDDDGSDLAYGAGLRFELGNFEVRGEYEVFDIEDTERVGMASVSLVLLFD